MLNVPLGTISTTGLGSNASEWDRRRGCASDARDELPILPCVSNSLRLSPFRLQATENAAVAWHVDPGNMGLGPLKDFKCCSFTCSENSNHPTSPATPAGPWQFEEGHAWLLTPGHLQLHTVPNSFLLQNRAMCKWHIATSLDLNSSSYTVLPK